ncbi:MAG: hypothetical protein ACKOWL_05190 [Sphingobacteriaceae bacterium]
MKRLVLAWVLLLSSAYAYSQELYVATEPASNMPKNSIGFRLTQEASFASGYKAKILPEVMLGISKNLMWHQTVLLNKVPQTGLKVSGWSSYAKYRFLSIDSTHSHFRGSLYARYSSVSKAIVANEINLEGDNSGWQTGVVFTQLLHKLALSGSVNYTRALNNKGGNVLPDGFSKEYIGYTLASGLLVYPKTYRDYKQTNVNVYLEFLGKSNMGNKQHLLEAAPAVQFIIHSTFRVDISQRVQVWSSMTREQKNIFLVRLEYNLFNAL